jgi:hypothetical protein
MKKRYQEKTIRYDDKRKIIHHDTNCRFSHWSDSRLVTPEEAREKEILIKAIRCEECCVQYVYMSRDGRVYHALQTCVRGNTLERYPLSHAVDHEWPACKKCVPGKSWRDQRARYPR